MYISSSFSVILDVPTSQYQYHCHYHLGHGAILALGRGLRRRQLVATRLHTLAVDTRGALVRAGLLLTAVVDVDDVEGVDVAGNVAEEREADVDEHIGAAAGDNNDTHGRDCKE